MLSAFHAFGFGISDNLIRKCRRAKSFTCESLNYHTEVNISLLSLALSPTRTVSSLINICCVRLSFQTIFRILFSCGELKSHERTLQSNQLQIFLGLNSRYFSVIDQTGTHTKTKTPTIDYNSLRFYLMICLENFATIISSD